MKVGCTWNNNITKPHFANSGINYDPPIFNLNSHALEIYNRLLSLSGRDVAYKAR